MDDTQGSRKSEAIATRKRRSSILKNQRPPRTPFSELEFNVATPTDTTKSRRVSFSRRTDVAEFVTNEATTTWKTMYVERNTSLESSGNESVMHPSRPTVCTLGKRAIFEQQFQEEALDLDTFIPNPRVHERNMSIMNINFSQQFAELEREDMKFSAPQKLELSSFTEDKSKLFGELTAPMTGVSNKIEVDFSAIQPVGDKCDELDEIQRDLLESNAGQQLRRPFDSPDAEYISVDLNTTHIGLKRDVSDMSITDSIHSPVIPQVEALKRHTTSSQKDCTADKENIVMNPYIAPKESRNFAINEIPDQVLVFDGRKLSVQTERQVFDRKVDDVEYHQPISSNDPPAQKKTIVLNVNDDLPNFANDATLLGQVHGLSTSKIDHKTNEPFQPNPVSIPTGLGLNSHKTVIYDDLAELSVTQAMPTNIFEKEKRKTIVFENDGGELSMTQALPSNFAPRSDGTQNRTVVYGNEDISFTQALPVKALSPPRDIVSQNRTVVYGSEDISFTQAVPVNVLSNEIDKTKLNFDISFTQALPDNVLLSNKSIQPNKRNTTVYGNDAGDISITRVLPSNIIVSDNVRSEKSIIPANSKSLDHKSIVYETGCDISMTQAVPKNIILANELKSNNTKIIYDNDENNISETRMLPSNILQPDGDLEESIKEQYKDDLLKESNKITTNMSITEAIPENVLLSHLIGKRKTIDAANMSVTRALPTNIITTEKNAIADDFNDFSITVAVPDNIVILNDVQKTNTLEQIDSRQKNLYVSEKEVAATDIALNVRSEDKMQGAEMIEQENLSKSFTEINLSKTNMDSTNIQAIHANQVEKLQESLHEIKETSDVLISDDKTEIPTKQHNASSNSKSTYSKSMSIDEDYENIVNKDEFSKEPYASILETSKRKDKNMKFDISNTDNAVIDKSYKQSEKKLHSFTTNMEKSGTEMSFRDVFVYQAVTEHNVSKQMQNIENVHTNISIMDIVPKSITLTNAIHSNDNDNNNDENIPKNKSLQTDLVALDGILEMSTKNEQKIGDPLSRSETVQENVISHKKKTLDLTELEVEHKDLIVESTLRNVSLAKEHKEQCSRISTIHNTPTMPQERKSILIEETSENMVISHSNKTKTMDQISDVKDDNEDIVMESPRRVDITLDKEEKEQYSRTATQQKMRKSIVTDAASENMHISHLNKRKTIDQTCVKEDHEDIVMDSPHRNDLTLAKEHEEQCSRMSTINNVSTTQRKPRKSILSELLKMSDFVNDECESAQTEMQDVKHNECNKTPKIDKELLQECKNDKRYKLTEVPQPNVDVCKQAIKEGLHSSKTEAHYDNVLSENFEGTHSNEPKESRENSMSDLSKEEIEKEEMIVDEAKEVSENHYKEADDTKELLEMLSDFTDKTMIKQSKEQPTERVQVQIASNENSYINEPRRMSLAKSRMSTVLSREDLLMNISMAYAALQQARTDTEESDIDDQLDDSDEDIVEPVEPEEIDAEDGIDQAIEELDNRRRSVRASTEVVKTLQFEDSTTDAVLKSDDNLSPLRKSVYGDISQTVDSRARVIPSYEVSDEVKSLMQDLVKPMADDTVFGKTSPEKSTKTTNSTRSINLQANIVTSSQIDIDMESESGIVSIDVQTEPEDIKNNTIQTLKPAEEPILRKSDQIRQTPPVLVFDLANPLNNVIIPKGNTEIHKYSPNKSEASIAEEKGSPMKSVLAKNNEEYEIQRVSTHYKINTSAVAMNYSREKDFGNQDKSDAIDDNSFDTHIKDSEVNTLIAMKCNKELLEETSCLTLVDDEDQEPIVIEDTQIDLAQQEKIETTSPLKVIFKTDVCDDNYTSSVDLDSDDASKPKKRIYSPAKTDPTKKVSISNPDVTPKPLSKIQKLSNTPNNGSKRASIIHQAESLNKSNVKTSEKAASSKGKFGGTMIVQQMAECKIDSSMEEVSAPKSEHSSCTLTAEVSSSVCRSPANAASKEVSFTHSDPLSCSIIKERETKVLDERESSANVLEKIGSLSFMGSNDCQWDWSDAGTWRFGLLSGRLCLTVQLGHVTGNRSRAQANRDTRHGHVRADTPVVSSAVEVVREDAEPILQNCLRLVCESMRYECVRGCVESARSVPTLLKRCVRLGKIARTWLRVMQEARMHLAYKMSGDGTVKLNVANIPLRTVYELTFHIELAVEDAKEAAWPRADRVRVRVTSGHERNARHADDVTPPDAIDVHKLLARVPHDWRNVPQTLWKVFRHLKNKTEDEWLRI